MITRLLYTLIIIAFINPFIKAQNTLITGAAPNPSQVEIVSADSLIGINQPFMEVRRLMGNVKLRQGTSTMYCNLAILNSTTNNLEAFGNVKIVQADTVTIVGDTAYYFGDSRRAIISGKTTKLDDKTITLTTRKIDYDLNSHLAYYNTGGKIVDNKSTLLSKEGYYNTVSKIFLAKSRVKITDKDGGTLDADSIKYSTLSKEAYFLAPTKIIQKQDTMYARAGSKYNTVTKLSNFVGRSTAVTQEYDITADSLFYDTQTQIGVAKGNTVFVSKKENVILLGNQGRYNGTTGYTRIFERALMKSVSDDNDTLYLAADTLVSFENKAANYKNLFAYKHVLLYKSDFSAKCDSLSYNTSDSTIFFYQKPILWNSGSQSEADSINVFLKNNKVNVMNLKGKSFVISKDTLSQFNQIKGRKITVNFDLNSKIDKVSVDGNAESIYFAVDQKNAYKGMNRVECSKMNMFFKKSKVKKIAFIDSPEAKFYPPKDAQGDIKELDGFKWKEAEKPTLKLLLASSFQVEKKEEQSIGQKTSPILLPKVKSEAQKVQKEKVERRKVK